MTTSHLTNPAKDAGQVIGYSHSTRLSKNDNQVAGYKSPKTATKWLVMLRCVKNFLLTYKTYVAPRNFSRALLTIPHGLLLPIADRRPLVGHLGEL